MENQKPGEGSFTACANSQKFREMPGTPDYTNDQAGNQRVVFGLQSWQYVATPAYLLTVGDHLKEKPENNEKEYVHGQGNNLVHHDVAKICRHARQPRGQQHRGELHGGEKKKRYQIPFPIYAPDQETLQQRHDAIFTEG